ncbi:MAG: iron-siderophore ABC transporter substrate-binding protein [Haloechinothrix sp.]
MSPTPTRMAGLRLPALLLALVLSLVLAACGSADEPAADDAAGQPQGAFPISVQHKYGATEISSEPKRVVTLGLTDQDAALALDVKPVGAIDWFKERPYGKWPWAKDLWGAETPEIVGERDDYNMEKIAALKPDLILAVYSGMTKEQYETLSKIAPVVGQAKGHDDYAAPWQDMTRQVGKALGKADEVEELISAIMARFEAIREEHAEFAEQTLVVADSFEPGKYTAFTSTDAKAIFFSELGFTLSPEVDKLAKQGWNAAEFSAERLDLLDVDRLVWGTASTEANERIKAEPLYKKLDVAKENRDLFVPYQDPDIGAAFSFNTVLSIPYAIDEMLPLLTADTK